MRARALFSVLVLGVVAVAGCDRGGVTGPEATDSARRNTQPTGGSSSDAATQGGYLGSGNRNDSTSTEPVSPSSTQP